MKQTAQNLTAYNNTCLFSPSTLQHQPPDGASSSHSGAQQGNTMSSDRRWLLRLCCGAGFGLVTLPPPFHWPQTAILLSSATLSTLPMVNHAWQGEERRKNYEKTAVYHRLLSNMNINYSGFNEIVGVLKEGITMVTLHLITFNRWR